MLEQPCPTCGHLLDINDNICPRCGLPRRRVRAIRHRPLRWLVVPACALVCALFGAVRGCSTGARDQMQGWNMLTGLLVGLLIGMVFYRWLTSKH